MTEVKETPFDANGPISDVEHVDRIADRGAPEGARFALFAPATAS